LDSAINEKDDKKRIPPHDASHGGQIIRLDPNIINIACCFQPERARVEHFIQHVYAETYGAMIGEHYPSLMSLRDGNDRIRAAAGFRMASREKLFLEYYSNTPIEVELSRAWNKDVGRNQIIEIGHLAADGCGASILLFTALARYLRKQGHAHVVVTGTSTLRRYFKTIGLNSKILFDANPKHVPDQGASWGSYYATKPKVLAGDISSGCARLEEFLARHHRRERHRLVTRLHYNLSDMRI